MSTETINWIDVNQQLPDDEITVLLFHPTLNEPVWIGYHLGGVWYTPNHEPITYIAVTHWAEIPAGPNELTKSELAKPDADPMRLRFPTMLRKMWSGGEVQSWLNDLPPLYTHPQRHPEPLSEEQIKAAFRDAFPKGPYLFTSDTVMFARAIERANGVGVAK